MTDRTRPVRHPEEVSCGTRFLLAAWVLSVKGWVGVVLCCPVSVQVAVQSTHPSCCTETWHPPSSRPARLSHKDARGQLETVLSLCCLGSAVAGLGPKWSLRRGSSRLSARQPRSRPSRAESLTTAATGSVLRVGT